MLDPDITNRLPKQSARLPLGAKVMDKEVATAMNAMVSAKAVGLDGLPVELLKLEIQQD